MRRWISQLGAWIIRFGEERYQAPQGNVPPLILINQCHYVIGRRMSQEALVRRGVMKTNVLQGRYPVKHYLDWKKFNEA